MKLKFLVVAMLMLFASMAMAQETYYNRTVEVADEIGYVGYSVSFAVSDTITATVYYTEAMQIGGLSGAYAYSTFQVAGTTTGVEDVNVFVEYADDPEATNANWVLGIGTTDSDLDAVGTTVVKDSIGLVQGTAEFNYIKFGWMRYKFVLGAANAVSKVMKANTKFIKPEGLKTENVGRKASTPNS